MEPAHSGWTLQGSTVMHGRGSPRAQSTYGPFLGRGRSSTECGSQPCSIVEFSLSSNKEIFVSHFADFFPSFSLIFFFKIILLKEFSGGKFGKFRKVQGACEFFDHI